MRREARRIHGELTEAEQERLRRAQAAVADELPDLIRRDQLRTDAAREPTFSGELRRVIHQGDLTLNELAEKTGTTPEILDDFLTGEGTLPSDVIDRMVEALGYRPSLTR